MKSTGNTFLITGGGTGIGLALAQRWHDMGNHVIITGRRQQVLQDAVAGRERMTAYALDVTAPDAVDRFVHQVIADHPDINILVNNAGIFSAEKVTTRRDISDAERMIETNIVGPMRLTNAMIDHLSGQPNAALINVSSGLAFVPFPAAPTYSAPGQRPFVHC